MLKSKLKYLKTEISFLETKVVENIENYLQDLDIEFNIIECKRPNHHGTTKQSKKYEVHFLDKCLTLTSSNRGITYRDTSLDPCEVEISEEFYTKLSIQVEMRLSIIKMENKLKKLKNLLLQDLNKENI